VALNNAYWDLFSPVNVPEMKLPGQQMAGGPSVKSTPGQLINQDPVLQMDPTATALHANQAVGPDSLVAGHRQNISEWTTDEEGNMVRRNQGAGSAVGNRLDNLKLGLGKIDPNTGKPRVNPNSAAQQKPWEAAGMGRTQWFLRQSGKYKHTPQDQMEPIPGGGSRPKQQKGSELLPGKEHIAGDIVPFPGYPGDEMARRLRILDLKERIIRDNPNASADSINKAFDDYFGGPAKILPMGPS
jgi:hypothetical protein